MAQQGIPLPWHTGAPDVGPRVLSGQRQRGQAAGCLGAKDSEVQDGPKERARGARRVVNLFGKAQAVWFDWHRHRHWHWHWHEA